MSNIMGVLFTCYLSPLHDVNDEKWGNLMTLLETRSKCCKCSKHSGMLWIILRVKLINDDFYSWCFWSFQNSTLGKEAQKDKIRIKLKVESCQNCCQENSKWCNFLICSDLQNFHILIIKRKWGMWKSCFLQMTKAKQYSLLFLGKKIMLQGSSEALR